VPHPATTETALQPAAATARTRPASKASDSNSAGPDSAGAAHGHLALHDAAAHVLFWLMAGVGLALDLWSKDWAFDTLRQRGHRTLIPRVLELETTLNSGALFGIGAGRTGLFVVASILALALVLWMFAQCPARRRLVQVALGAILAGALGNMYDRVFVRLYGLPTAAGPRYYVRTDGPHDASILLREYPPDATSPPRPLSRAREAELGEPVGHVRDFIKIPTTLPQWDWIPARWRGKELWPWVFNVADSLLVGGVAVLALRMLRDRRRAPSGAPHGPGSGGVARAAGGIASATGGVATAANPSAGDSPGGAS
jgi:lipoprotein signal peptidase